MKKIIVLILCLFALQIPAPCAEKFAFSDIGFHKKLNVAPETQIKQIFKNYEKYCNNQDLERFLNLHDDSYLSSDGYNKDRLKDLAIESWKEFPDVKYSIKILSVAVNLDNATVITREKLSGTTNTPVEFVKGSGYIDSDSTSIYYLKRFSNDWKIVSDFVINEKTSMRYGIAKYVPMYLDAPAIVAPEEDYTAILKINAPKSYISLISIANEPITYPFQHSAEVFRTLKPSGIQERILTSNCGKNNENAIASVGIAKADIKNNDINVNIVGIAFLSSRVNVIKNKHANSTLHEIKSKVSGEKI